MVTRQIAPDVVLHTTLVIKAKRTIRKVPEQVLDVGIRGVQGVGRVCCQTVSKRQIERSSAQPSIGWFDLGPRIACGPERGSGPSLQP